MEPVNIIQFRNLVKKYETITLDKIKSVWKKQHGYGAANLLTGFGKYTTCKLCLKTITAENPDNSCAAELRRCDLCVYGGILACCGDENQDTYDRIKNASSPLTLFNAYRARARYLRKKYSKYL